MAKTLTYAATDAEALTKNIYVCGICGRLMGEQKDFADRCCTCTVCLLPIESNGKPGGWGSSHAECEVKRIAEVEARQIEKAEKLETWDGPVYYNDNFYTDLDALTDYLEDTVMAKEDWPTWAFVCDQVRFPLLVIDDIIQNLEENHEVEDYDGVNVSEETMAALEAAAQKFNAETKDDVGWHPNFKKMARIPT